jgi:hypothetical protein
VVGAVVGGVASGNSSVRLFVFWSGMNLSMRIGVLIGFSGDTNMKRRRSVTFELICVRDDERRELLG